ncbi:glutaminyl-peptide cyclotransferase [Pedobacter polaris]|uniref:Glutaminyl-peptide cyclotransferase n=1 Tax=Pedobacter polaris TaxID=2571273 RepID=A0A4U1CTY7_9SPHI|nr:glutaminyl-peptide cyclotransferase [Pedobacter polaris]TKC12274.1 glutaminyl-peptide cyclotransferase [Pedobacter polaris]
MHFGLLNKSIKLITIAFLVVLAFGCRDDENVLITFSTPNQGDNFNVGDEVKIKLDVPKNIKIDSVVYMLDGKLISKHINADSILLPTKNLLLGYRMITAIVTIADKKDTINTNVVLKTNQVPKQLTYKIVNTFPHDTSAYTEGLSYVDGKLLESTGENGRSELKYIDLKSGKTLQRTKLDPQYFGEGSLKIGDKIIMLTWKENMGFIFDAKTFKQLGSFPYQNSREGWGLTFDGKNILRSDGSNRIWLMNANTLKEESYIEIYDNNGPVDSLNELEFINGKIYANVYLSNKIVIINPLTGAVESQLDLTALVPKDFFKTSDEIQNNVLNGIAWDANGKRLFVGGKKWPKLYEIKIVH